MSSVPPRMKASLESPWANTVKFVVFHWSSTWAAGHCKCDVTTLQTPNLISHELWTTHVFCSRIRKVRSFSNHKVVLCGQSLQRWVRTARVGDHEKTKPKNIYIHIPTNYKRYNMMRLSVCTVFLCSLLQTAAWLASIIPQMQNTIMLFFYFYFLNNHTRNKLLIKQSFTEGKP